MKVRLYMEFGSIRCILRKMDPNYAFVCDEKILHWGIYPLKTISSYTKALDVMS